MVKSGESQEGGNLKIKAIMFIGQYSHSLDSKGRVAVPAKFRAELKSAVVTKGLDNCLFLYPQKEWEKMAETVANMPIDRSDNRKFSRAILAGATEVEFDKQGRIILPEYLRSFAGISKNVVIAGLYNRLEIWDEEKWNTYKEDSDKNYNSIAETLNDLRNSVTS
ncbi:MAG: division/cell wall cluster transcriptional repressor MraZ [Candidatus Buchananbacteria bacterium]